MLSLLAAFIQISYKSLKNSLLLKKENVAKCFENRIIIRKNTQGRVVMKNNNDNNSTFSSFKDLTPLKEEFSKFEKERQEKQRKHFLEAKQIIEQLKKAYPIVFSVDEPLPLAVGIEKVLRKLHPDFVVPALRFALSIWTKREKYLLAIIAGDNRYNLDGSVAGSLQDSEKEYSKTLLDNQRKKKKHSQVAKTRK